MQSCINVYSEEPKSVTAFNLFTFFHADKEDSFQLASDWIKSAWKNVNKPEPVTLLGFFL